MKFFIILALIWTVVVFFMLNIVFPYVNGSEITTGLIIKNSPVWLAGLPIWLICGVIYTYITKNKNRKSNEELG